MYYLKDGEDKPIKGGFYEPEVQLVKYAHVYLVETIVKHDKKNKRVLVKWLGFSDKHNSWVPESDVIE